MIPLAICSVVGLAIVIERLVALRPAGILRPGIVERIHALRSEEHIQPLLSACAAEGGSLSRIVEQVVNARHDDTLQQVETLNAAGRHEVERMERGLVVLEIVANISPLIGLLGTVLGMVTVFEAITAEGLGDPQVLSEGISKALVTTVAGLCVAIPSLAFHSYLSSRVDSIAVDLHDQATELSSRLRSASGRSRPR